MARDLTTAQFDSLQADATRPLYLVQIAHGGFIEYLATGDACAFDGNAYTAGGIEVLSIQDGVSASLSFFATQTRINQSAAGAWRKGQVCRIYYIPAVPGDEADFLITDAFLVFDGIIDVSSFRGDSIQVTAIPKNTATLYSPRNNFSEISDIYPPAGTVFSWSTSVYYTLQAKQ